MAWLNFVKQIKPDKFHSVQMLLRAVDCGYKISQNTLKLAAKSGSVELCIYLLQNGCEWSLDIIYTAFLNNNLIILEVRVLPFFFVLFCCGVLCLMVGG